MAERVSGLAETMRYLQYLTPFLLLLAACSSNVKTPDLVPTKVMPDKLPDTTESIHFSYGENAHTTLHVLNYTDRELDMKTIEMMAIVMLAIGDEKNEVSMADKWGNSVTTEAGFRMNLKNVYFYFVGANHPDTFAAGLPPEEKWPGLTWAGGGSETAASSVLTENDNPDLDNSTLVDLSVAVEMCQAFLEPKTSKVVFADVTPSPSFVHYLIRGNYPEQEGLCNPIGARIARTMHPDLSDGLRTEKWPTNTITTYKLPARAEKYEQTLAGRHVLVK